VSQAHASNSELLALTRARLLLQAFIEKQKKKPNHQTNTPQNLKTVIHRVIEITSKRTQIFHGGQAYVSSLGSMETSWRRKGYWENQNGGEQYYFFYFFVNMSFWAGICNVSGGN